MVPRVIAVLSHARPQETDEALSRLLVLARERGLVVRVDENEADKHDIVSGDGVEVGDAAFGDVELAFALGGDGTVLRALRRFAGTGVPVFGVNYGEIGFLATVEPDDSNEGFIRALGGDFEALKLPAIKIDDGISSLSAINDVAITRRAGDRVAELAYAVGGEEVGRVRCDGLVVATPAGSTGYNLANGGPVLAWGVEGYVVSFIAPHSLTARALVVAPDDVLTVHNRSDAPVDLSVDGRPTGELDPGGTVTCGFVRETADLAMLPGSTFYRRLRDTFGRLSS
jgi:NAD+ kinase